MATLEEMMPELAGVLAAQESALETVVATLTTHVHELRRANEQQSRRIQQLEDARSEAREEMKELQRALAASQAETAALAETQRRVEKELESVHAESRVALERVIATAEALGSDTTKRLEAYVDERLEKVEKAARVEKVESSDGARQSMDEDAHTRLDLLEKKFDYLSRVKLEIKDLERTVERQEKTIDGMKIGLEMLSKSIGVDEDNSDGSDGGDNGDPNDSDSDVSDVQLPANEIFDAHSPPKLSALTLNLDRLRDLPPEDAERVPSDRVLEEKDRKMATPHAQIKRLTQRRSVTLDHRHALEIKEAHRKALTSRGGNQERRTTSPQVVLPITEAAVVVEENSSREVGDNEEEPAVADESQVESIHALHETQRDDTEDSSAIPEVTPVDTLNVPDTNHIEDIDQSIDEGQEQQKEQEEEDKKEEATEEEKAGDGGEEEEKEEEKEEENAEAIPAPESLTPECEEQSQVPPIAEEPETPTPPDTGRSEQQGGESTAPVISTARSSAVATERDHSDSDIDSDRMVDTPGGYRERTLSHQKELEDTVALFRPSSSSSAASTSRGGFPNSSRMLQGSSASAIFRSRRQVRTARRQTLLGRKEAGTPIGSRQMTTRASLSHNDKRETWRRIFAKLVQLRRLHLLNGAVPEKSLFGKQNVSVGSRVRRLEETAVDLEKAIELLETNIQTNAHGVQALGELLSQHHLTIGTNVQNLVKEQKAQSQALTAMDEKMEVLDQEVRRLRASSRRNNVPNNLPSMTAMTAVSEKVDQLSTRLDEQIEVLQATEALTNRLATTDIPAAQARADESLSSVRVELERRLKEWAADTRRSYNALNTALSETNRSLSVKVDGSFHHLYEDVLFVTTAMLRGAELVQEVATPASTSKEIVAQAQSPLNAGIEMLESILDKFSAACTSVASCNDSADALLVADQAVAFLHELQQLKQQAAKAMSLLAASTPSPSLDSTGDNSSSQAAVSSAAASSSKGFVEYLIQETTKYLSALESLLAHHEMAPGSRYNPEEAREREVDPADSELTLHTRDTVVQIRGVLFLLQLSRYASDGHQEFQSMQTAQKAMSQDLTSHSFTLSQVESMLAMVKLMNTRLDSFMELSITFAKDEDVKKSIQEMVNTSSSMRDKFAKQLEDTQQEASQRDAIFERDLSQLVSRVNKKLDKDELLWTQEVLERQLQSVAKASLGEEDLLDIHRLLRHKLDKAQFNALVQDQRANMTLGSNANSMAGGGSASGSGPLVGAKCISCQGDLPPSKAMIKTVVKQEVQHEIAKAKTQHQVAALMPSPGSAGFNVSNHRSMEKFKTELLLSSLQKQAKK